MEGNNLSPLLADQEINWQWQKTASLNAEYYFKMMQDKQITIGDKTLRFEYFTFGQRPYNGYSLLIGMHGGGGCAKEANDKQFDNHLHLYDSLIPEGVIWLVPRSCEDAWDMWFKSYLPEFFTTMIKALVLIGLVNPNKVFISGFSAGGDGAYHLGPMMADWVAGVAMMSGHPNGVQMFNNRNITFSIQVGGKDSAYNRNNLGKEYIQKMKELGIKYGGFSTKYCYCFQECGHWLNLRDGNIFNNLLREQRNPYPVFVLFKQHNRIKKKYFYYIEVDPERHKELLIVYQRRNQFFIESELMPVTIYVNRLTVDQNQIKIYHNGTLTVCRKPQKDHKIVEKSIREREDPFYIFEDCFISIPTNSRVSLPFNVQQVMAEQQQMIFQQKLF